MRPLGVLVGVLSLLLSACGGTGETTTTIERQGTTTTSSSPVATTAGPTTTMGTTSTTEQGATAPWTVDRYGRTPVVILGAAGALGSGCSPGTDLLPDGIWFGWIDDVGGGSVDFDLACLWQGRLEPAASNDASRIRTLPVEPDTVVYTSTGELQVFEGWNGAVQPVANAPGLPGSPPFWLFVNDGVVTEISEYPEPIHWARSSDAWPGLEPGCCDGGDVAPPSPEDPLPKTGWPANGFYKAWNMSGAEYVQDWPESAMEGSYELQIARWLSCTDNPGLCPEWWVDDEVTTLPDGPFLERTLPFDGDMTVVIMPIFGEAAIVGDGVAFGRLLADLNEAVDTWARPGVDLYERSADPSFPFGQIPWPGESQDGELGYRGPGGAHLTWFGGWMALEIRDGHPILYIHAGQVAG